MENTIKSCQDFDKAVLGIMVNYPQTTMADAEEREQKMDTQDIIKWAKFYDEYTDACYQELAMAFAEFY